MAGAISGMSVAVVYIAVAPLMVFYRAKDPSSLVVTLQDRIPPKVMMMGLVVIGYPIWIASGALLGLVYKAIDEQVPGGGLGSPNLLFSSLMLGLALSLAAPLAILLRRVVVGVAVMTLAFAAGYGWMLPLIAG